jgi:ketosteroid isomerase-like protein
MNLMRRQILAGVADAFVRGSLPDYGFNEADPTSCGHSNPPKELMDAIESYGKASRAFMNGDPRPLEDIYSHCEDVTIFGGFGSYEAGWNQQVQKRLAWASARFRGGETQSERISLITTPELAYSTDLEHLRARLKGIEAPVPMDLRVTTIYRREGQQWKVVHRHADPLVKVQNSSSLIRK